MDKLTLRSELEGKANLVNLIRLICDRYSLDPALQINITNIRAFLAPLRIDSIVAKANDLDSANEYIVNLYGENAKASKRSLVSEINNTNNFLMKIIKTPGDNVSKDSGKSKFTNRETFASDTNSSFLKMPQADRIEMVKYLNYQSLFREEYVVVDSRYQNKVNPDPTKLMFSLLGNTKTKSDNGGIIIGANIRDIVEIEVYPFTIPYKPVYATFYNKITLSINEWTTNSFEAYEGGQFHFCFDIDKIDNNLIYLKPVNPTYSFSIPVNYIDAFTLSFGAVYPKIIFDPDRMVPSEIDFSNPYGLFTFDSPHGLVSGDLVYISGFSTPDSAKDMDIITEVNRSEGHTIVKKDPYSILINVDLTAVRYESPINSGRYPIDSFNQDVVVYFASKRIQIQMRFRYLTSYLS